VLALVALVVFMAIATTAQRGLWSDLDDLVAKAMTQVTVSHPRALVAWHALSTMHTPRAIVAWTVCAAAGLLLRRRALAATALIAVVFGGATAIHLVKHYLRRPRPGLGEIAGAATDFSFPSGHVANATLLYGVLVVVAWPALRTARRRAGAVAVASLAVALVAGSRIALGAHRLSDVLAGPPLALAWLAAGLAAATLWEGMSDTGERS
jgi:membrane-associated phospholipid phosphatase